MAKKKKKKKMEQRSFVMFTEDENALSCLGYSRLSDCPEVRMAVERIADLVSAMTIHLMENNENGDVRVKNGLSRKVDINPCEGMTKQNWISWIVKSLVIEGNAVVLPDFDKGLIKNLLPVPWSKVTTISKFGEYAIKISGQDFKAEDILHFRINPKLEDPWVGEAYKVSLNPIIKNLKQARHTTNEFMSNRVIPNLIVKVDALTDELANTEGRERVYDKYLSASKSGEPWIIPAGLIDVQQVKPLTLNDIAIKDTIDIDKRTVASLLGVPAFILGLGEFNSDEYNNFIRTKIMHIAKAIEQELTAKLLYSEKHYFKLNPKSLYAYSFTELASIYMEMYTKGICTRNETRDAIGLCPLENSDELVMLENFIPASKIGDQKKLKGGD